MTVNCNSKEIRALRGVQFCWLCGATPSLKPDGWGAEFRLEIAHIASGQGDALRIDDIRAVTLLCSRCHKLHVSDSDRLPTMNINGIDYPTIDARHTLWIKMKLDREYYDRKFLAEFWIGTVPIPEKPPNFFLEELAKNQGLAIS